VHHMYGAKFHPSKICPKWLLKQSFDHASERHWDMWEPIWL
jgi:hypothetical protein